MINRRVVLRARGGPESLEVVEEVLPEPASGGVRVRVLAAGVAFGDIMWQTGTVPGGPKPPYTPGYDVVGVVDALGPGTAGVEVGTRVAALVNFGGYSDYVCASADSLVRVPDTCETEAALCLTLNYVSAWQILTRVAGLAAGQRVLVHGAGGGVGTAMLQIAQAEGIEAYGTVSAGKAALVESLGGIPINYRKEDFVDRVFALAGDGVDAVVDHIGGADHLKRSFRTLRRGGRLVVTSSYMAARGDASPFSAVLGLLRLPVWNLLPNRRSTVLYDVVGFCAKHPGAFQEDLTRLLKWLTEGRLAPIIAARFALEDAQQAQELLLNERPGGKILLRTASA